MTTAVVSLNDFSGGMVGDDRTTTPTNVVSLIKNFDPVSRKHRLTPYNATINADASSSTHQITDFLFYSGSLTTGLYGLGVNSSNVQIFNKDSTTSGSSWSTFANSIGSASGSAQPGVFVQYQGKAYGGHVADGTIWKCDLGGASFTNADTTLDTAPTCNGVVHPIDDTLYMGAANKISKNASGSWTVNALVLPVGFTISALAVFNSSLAIGCNGSDGKAVVFLWDRNSSLTNVPTVADWGIGTLKVLKQVEEHLIGVSLSGTSGLYPKMVFRKYISGSGGEVFNELFASSIVGLQAVPNSSRANNRLYFAGGITIDGTLHNGIFAVQRPTGSSEFSVWIDKLPNNDTAIAASSLQGFLHVNDYVFISYNDGGFSMMMTSNVSTAYNSTAYCETTINQGMKIADRTKSKSLKAVAVTTVPLGVDGGKVVLDYKVDGGAWTTILTTTATGSVTTEAFVDATGTSFTSGREFKFRVKAGGTSSELTEPVEIKYSYEILETLL